MNDKFEKVSAWQVDVAFDNEKQLEEFQDKVYELALSIGIEVVGGDITNDMSEYYNGIIKEDLHE